MARRTGAMGITSRLAFEPRGLEASIGPSLQGSYRAMKSVAHAPQARMRNVIGVAQPF